MAHPRSIYRLSCRVQEYEWGKQGSSSLVAQLAPNARGPAFTLRQDGSYAELWVGTHPNAPSDLFSSTFAPVPAVSTSLSDLLSSHPDRLLGPALLEKWPGVRQQLPYLFKVLSIAKALPLQAHPDRKLGERLHREDPESYVDENHKPEIAVVVGEPGAAEWIPFGGGGSGGGGGGEERVGFTGFVGFRPVEEIVEFVKTVPELKDAVGNNAAVEAFVSDPTKDNLKKVWNSLLERGKNEAQAVGTQVKALLNRLSTGDNSHDLKDANAYARLIEKMNEQYKGDVGVLAATFFMNFVQLKQGDAIWIPADDVHAYLEGDIIECMATSDNVVNASFTPPDARDVHTFSSMLTYSAHPWTHWSLESKSYERSRHGLTYAYAPPLPEFVVLDTKLDGDNETEVLQAVNGPTCGIVTNGKVRLSVQGEDAMELEKGMVVFVAPDKDIEITTRAMGGQAGQACQAEVWWATCNV